MFAGEARRIAQVAYGIAELPPLATPVSDNCCLTIGFGCRLCGKEAFFRF